MIHLIYLAILLAIVLAAAIQRRELRFAFFAACNQRDAEIAARQEAETRYARAANNLSAARRLLMEQAAQIESQGKLLTSQGAQLDAANDTLKRLYARAQAMKDFSASISLPTCVEQQEVGQQSVAHSLTRITAGLPPVGSLDFS